LFGTADDGTIIVFEPTTVYDVDEIESAHEIGIATTDDHVDGIVTEVGTKTNDEAATVTTLDDKTVKTTDDGTDDGTFDEATMIVFEPTTVN
jgi:hypothetical protein